MNELELEHEGHERLVLDCPICRAECEASMAIVRGPVVVPCTIPDCGLASLFGPVPAHYHPALVA